MRRREVISLVKSPNPLIMSTFSMMAAGQAQVKAENRELSLGFPLFFNY